METKTEELRLKTIELEKKIRTLLHEFTEENGACDIKIKTKITFIQYPDNTRHITSINPKVYLTI